MKHGTTLQLLYFNTSNKLGTTTQKGSGCDQMAYTFMHTSWFIHVKAYTLKPVHICKGSSGHWNLEIVSIATLNQLLLPRHICWDLFHETYVFQNISWWVVHLIHNFYWVLWSNLQYYLEIPLTTITGTSICIREFLCFCNCG